MGARPSSFKSGGGGFLHDVDAKIVNQEFTTTSPGGTEDSDHVFWRLTVLEDGSDEEKSTSLFVGKAEEFRIEDPGPSEGKTLVRIDADGDPDTSWTFNKGDDVGLFIASLVNAGFDESELPENDINFEAIEGRRVHLTQERNEERMKYRAAEFKKGNKRDKGGNEYNEKGQRKNKGADKFYDIRYLSVSDVYGEKKGESGKPANKSSSKSSGPSTQDVADEVLLTILGKQPKIAGKQSLDKSKLPNAIAAQMGTKNPQLQEVRKLIYEDEFLERNAGWKYDKDSKKQTITLG